MEQLVDMFPSAPLYTSMYWRTGMPASYRQWDIRPSWMDKLPGIYRRHQWYFPLYALAFACLDVSQAGYDVVISNKSGFCHGTYTGATPHLCYCLAPTRYVWEFEAYAAREQLPAAVKVLLRPVIALLRRWDYRVAQRTTTQFVAISREIQSRISQYYGRESTIIYPPVDVARYTLAPRHEDYYLIVSRLIPYKRIDLAVRVFTELGWPLRIVGKGRDRESLERLAGPTVEFLGYVPDADLPDLLSHCKAFVFPGREDFGLTPVEAQAAGRPVIAFGAGGALDSVIEGETGTFFQEPTVESLREAVLTFDANSVSPLACRANAERFSATRFRHDLTAIIAHVSDTVGEQLND